MKRYHCPAVQINHEKWGTPDAISEVMIELETGKYVLYSDVAPILAERDRLRKALDAFNRYFISGNTVPVERATILAKSEAVQLMRTALTPEDR